MTADETRTILEYISAIPGTIEELHKGKRTKRTETKILVLKRDKEVVLESLDTIYGKYRGVLKQRYVYGYSWNKISCYLGYPSSTIRNWHDRGVERLAQVLDEVPMIDELLERARKGRA